MGFEVFLFCFVFWVGLLLGFFALASANLRWCLQSSQELPAAEERCSSTWGAHRSLGDARKPLVHCLGVTPLKKQSNNPLGAQKGPFLTGTL